MAETETTPQETPAWLHDYVSRLLDTFNLSGWRFNISVLSDVAMEEKAGTDTAAYTDINDCYLDAHFYFLDSILDDDHGREHILHEVLHCVLKPLNQTGRYLQGLIPHGRAVAVADAIWVDGVEESVIRLARAVAPLIDWSAE